MPRHLHQAIADQVGGGLVPGSEQENAVVQELLLAQPLAIVLALDEPRQHIALGVAGPAAPPLDQHLQILKKLLYRLVAARKNLVANDRFERAQNRERPIAQ